MKVTISKQINDLSQSVLSSLDRLGMRPFYLIPERNDSYLLQTEHKTLALNGQMLNELVNLFFPLLDGSRTAAQIRHQLVDRVPAEKVTATLEALAKQGLLESIATPPAQIPQQSISYFNALRRHLSKEDLAGWDAVQDLQSAHVAIVGSNSMMYALVEDLLAIGIGQITLFGNPQIHSTDIAHSARLTVDDEGHSWLDILRARLPLHKTNSAITYGGACPDTVNDWEQQLPSVDLLVVCQRGISFFNNSLRSLNSVAQRRYVPLTVIADIHKVGLSVGPTIIPGETACYRCFELRFKSNLRQAELFQRVEQHIDHSLTEPEFGCFAPSEHLLAALAAHEIRDLLVKNRLALSVGKMISLNLEDGYDLTVHSVLRVPRCEVCGKVHTTDKVRAWN
ncbi:MAG: TOMM precursor leader peptide-binding protein [Alishewanella aestuarii]